MFKENCEFTDMSTFGIDQLLIERMEYGVFENNISTILATYVKDTSYPKEGSCQILYVIKT